MLEIAGKPKVGRVQCQIRRAFIAAGGRPLTIADLLFPPGGLVCTLDAPERLSSRAEVCRIPGPR
jgi:hypothetical protein